MTRKERTALIRVGLSYVALAFAPMLTVPFLGWGGPWWIGFAALGTMVGLVILLALVVLWAKWAVPD